MKYIVIIIYVYVDNQLIGSSEFDIRGEKFMQEMEKDRVTATACYKSLAIKQLTKDKGCSGQQNTIAVVHSISAVPTREYSNEELLAGDLE